MKQKIINEYDKERVECCGSCKSLYLKEEDLKILCMSCGKKNLIEILPTIFQYLRIYGI